MAYTSLPRELSAGKVGKLPASDRVRGHARRLALPRRRAAAAALPAPMTRGSGPAVRQEIPSPTIHTHRGGLTHPASHIL